MFKHLLFIVLSISILSACGTYNAGETQGEGSVSFSLEWERPSTSFSPLLQGEGQGEGGVYRAASPDVCVDYGISTISAYILDSSNATIKSATWSCSSHSGTISGVPSGSSYMIRLEGANTSSMVTWRGEKTSISVASGSTTSAGSVTMTYIGSDTTVPTVSSVSPSSGAANVVITTSITATFSENMAASTIDTSTFTLKQGSTTVNGSVTYDATTKTTTFTPSANLSYSTTYTATITTGAKDMAGNAMVSSYSWSFTTTTSLLMGGSIQGTPLNLTSTNATVTTFAGSVGLTGSTDATGAVARFYHPDAITTDGTNLFVADSNNHAVRKIEISTGVVTTIAGSAGLSGSTDGIGAAARFNAPICITTDGINLFVADYNSHTIRKIVISTGAVTTIAGSAGLTGSTDGTGSAARFNLPHDITTDGANLFVADYGNHTIRKIVIATGVVTTIAGSASVSGLTDGIGTAARFNGPVGITTDGTNLFVTDYWNHTIRKIVISTGVVTTIAGSAGLSGSTDGTGTSARFTQPVGITTDGTNLFVAAYDNHKIRKVVISSGVVTTLTGSGTAASFNYPQGITTDGTNLFVADWGNHTIRKISPGANFKMPDTNQATSYTTTFGEDADYTINPPSYTDNGYGTVTDNVTGLVWQKQDDGTTRTWADADTYCSSLSLGGQTDWRLPSQIELISIIDNGVYDPSIKTTFFPSTFSSNYWSSNTKNNFTSHAWSVYFSNGFSYGSYKTESFYARCVRGEQAPQTLTDNGNGTVTDSGTNLTWQQGENSAMTWEAALSYCEGLTLVAQADWRLPNHKELLSLVDYTKYNPSINTTLFPNALSSSYWSSTTVTSDTSGSWYVDFNGGGSSNHGKANSDYVRCVRGGE